jgi:hypothetical protein
LTELVLARRGRWLEYFTIISVDPNDLHRLHENVSATNKKAPT